VAAIVLALHFLLPVLTRPLLSLPFGGRLAVTLLLVGVAGFFMGIPMPLGVRHLHATERPIIPWAWAVNGYFTVIGTALSVLLAMIAGFTTVFLIAAAVYAAAPFFLRPAKM